MISDNKIANAVSGRTARACDCCIRRRARWYCAADDAFLCQACDGSVHSANPLARRHQRVRLTTASAPVNRMDPDDLPSWQRGLTRKARSPRHAKHQGSKSEGLTLNPLPTVPELGAEDTTSSSLGDETDDQHLYRVPIFDPFVDSQNGYESLDMELEEFAADVETLLGKGLDEESYGIEELGLLGSCNNKNNEAFDYGRLIKAEKDDVIMGNNVEGEDVEMMRESFDFGFDMYGEDYDKEEQKEVMKVDDDFCKWGEVEDEEERDEEKVKRRKKLLRLDYEAISAAWSEASPWINGERPQINPQDCWPHCMGTSGIDLGHPMHYGDHHHQMGGIGMKAMGDGGREARVTRYREKRRTRLFAKKIRYQVRKLNAEKRPRMKGRFVKRSSFLPSPATAFPLLSK